MALADRELMGRIVRHDAAAFEALSLRYREPLRRHLSRMVRDADTAEDLLQETLLRLWTHAGQWDGRGAARAWLFRIATTIALNHLRSAHRRPQQPLEPPPDDDATPPAWMIDTASLGPEDAFEFAERRDRLRRLIAGLPESKRDVLRLAHDEELDIADIARTLGIPPGTVKSRLHYASRRLAREWRALEEDD